jgi:RNA polymerase sigma-70 factor (ECF subfamily)
MIEDCSACSDEDLIRLIVRHHQGALGELYERYHRLIYSLAYAALNDVQIAEEVAQDVFLRVWEKARTYQAEKAKVSTWLISITRHRLIDWFRNKQGRFEEYCIGWEEWSKDSETGSNDLSTEESVERNMQLQRIRAAIAALPFEQRQALSLAYFQGYTHRQIAEILGEPPGTIKTRILLAMRKLRHSLQEEQT